MVPVESPLKAHWIVQENLYGSGSLEDLLAALERLELPYTRVKVVPFLGTLEPEPVVSGPVIAMGATTMLRVARERGWTPGVWDQNMSFRTWQKHWYNGLLNRDAFVIPFYAVGPFWDDRFFLRPDGDTKAFGGQCFTWPEFEEWRRKVIEMNEDGYGYAVEGEKAPGQLQADTMVVAAKPQEILREYRCFIVDGKVVTASLYKLGSRVTSTGPVEDEIVRFANEWADVWSPDRAYAMDVAVTPNGLRIVEANQINCAGFYGADVMKIVAALDTISES